MEVIVDRGDRRAESSESDALLEKRKNALETPETLNPFRDTPFEPEHVLYRVFKVCPRALSRIRSLVQYVVVALVLLPIRALLCIPAIAGLLLIFQVCLLHALHSPLLSHVVVGDDRVGFVGHESALDRMASRVLVAVGLLLAHHFLQLGIPLDHHSR
jgi:hypothetical protein